MAQQWSKDDILAAYLNTIYFGRGAYGIEAASKAYFGKPVEELTVEEGAVLASIDPAAVASRSGDQSDRRGDRVGTTCSTAWSSAGTLDQSRPACGA